MARIERPFDAEPAPVAASVARKPFLEGLALPEFLIARVKSRYWAAPGVWVAPVRTEKRPSLFSKTYLLGVGRNMVMPVHDHGSSEMTLVLQGGFSDADGDYTVGDFIEKAPGEPHSPSTDGTEGCVSLITHERPIKPLTLLGKLLKPFARI
jgi:putative transcriptional regulator